MDILLKFSQNLRMMIINRRSNFGNDLDPGPDPGRLLSLKYLKYFKVMDGFRSIGPAYVDYLQMIQFCY